MIKKFIIVISFVLVGMIAFIGLKKSDNCSLLNIDEANKRGILLVGIGPDPEGLDPHFATGVTEQNVLRALFEGLVVPDASTLEPLPGVAETWDISADGLRYTFCIREDAKWSNGDNLTANDFVFAFRRFFNPQIAAAGVNTFFVIKNAKLFYEKKLERFDEVGVRAVNDKTLEFELEHPTAYFLNLLMLPSCYPLHEKTLAATNSINTRNHMWTKPGLMVSNGPFYLSSWKVGQTIHLLKNSNYWNSGAVKLNGIQFKPIADVTTEERAFRTGQLHITENVPYSKMATYSQMSDNVLRVHNYLGTYYYLLNVHIAPLNDIRVRKALSMAIDRNNLSGSDQLKLKHKSAYSLVPEGFRGYNSIAKVDENVEEARKLLAEAGFPNGAGFPKLKIMFNTSEGQTYIALAIQEIWKKTLNIDVELDNQEWKVYLSNRRARNFEIARGGWIGDYNDPLTFLENWASLSPNNFVGWKNSTFDAYMEQAKNTNDAGVRFSYLQEAEKILIEDLPLIPLHSSLTSHLVHSSVKNWHTNLLDWHPYNYIELK